MSSSQHKLSTTWDSDILKSPSQQQLVRPLSREDKLRISGQFGPTTKERDLLNSPSQERKREFMRKRQEVRDEKYTYGVTAPLLRLPDPDEEVKIQNVPSPFKRYSLENTNKYAKGFGYSRVRSKLETKLHVNRSFYAPQGLDTSNFENKVVPEFYDVNEYVEANIVKPPPGFNDLHGYPTPGANRPREYKTLRDIQIEYAQLKPAFINQQNYKRPFTVEVSKFAYLDRYLGNIIGQNVNKEDNEPAPSSPSQVQQNSSFEMLTVEPSVDFGNTGNCLEDNSFLGGGAVLEEENSNWEFNGQLQGDFTQSYLSHSINQDTLGIYQDSKLLPSLEGTGSQTDATLQHQFASADLRNANMHSVDDFSKSIVLGENSVYQSGYNMDPNKGKGNSKLVGIDEFVSNKFDSRYILEIVLDNSTDYKGRPATTGFERLRSRYKDNKKVEKVVRDRNNNVGEMSVEAQNKFQMQRQVKAEALALAKRKAELIEQTTAWKASFEAEFGRPVTQADKKGVAIFEEFVEVTAAADKICGEAYDPLGHWSVTALAAEEMSQQFGKYMPRNSNLVFPVEASSSPAKDDQKERKVSKWREYYEHRDRSPSQRVEGLRGPPLSPLHPFHQSQLQSSPPIASALSSDSLNTRKNDKSDLFPWRDSNMNDLYSLFHHESDISFEEKREQPDINSNLGFANQILESADNYQLIRKRNQLTSLVSSKESPDKHNDNNNNKNKNNNNNNTFDLDKASESLSNYSSFSPIKVNSASENKSSTAVDVSKPVSRSDTRSEMYRPMSSRPLSASRAANIDKNPSIFALDGQLKYQIDERGVGSRLNSRSRSRGGITTTSDGDLSNTRSDSQSRKGTRELLSTPFSRERDRSPSRQSFNATGDLVLVGDQIDKLERTMSSTKSMNITGTYGAILDSPDNVKPMIIPGIGGILPILGPNGDLLGIDFLSRLGNKIERPLSARGAMERRDSKPFEIGEGGGVEEEGGGDAYAELSTTAEFDSYVKDLVETEKSKRNPPLVKEQDSDTSHMTKKEYRLHMRKLYKEKRDKVEQIPVMVKEEQDILLGTRPREHQIHANYDKTLLPRRCIIELSALRSLYIETEGSKWKDATGWQFCKVAPKKRVNKTRSNFTGIEEKEDATDPNGGTAELEKINSTTLRQIKGVVVDRFNNVVEINLKNNDLSGIFPENIRDILQLEVLQLNFNNISGVFTGNSIQRLKNLETICLSHNRLTGRIPWYQLCDLPKLRELLLNHNEFEGGIPDFVFTDPSTSNQITADPNNVCWTNTLRNLSLNNNKLTGPVPSTIRFMKRLEVLCLSNNELSGPLPDGIQSLYLLSSLSLAHNKFTGKAPNFMFSMQFLKASDCNYEGNLFDRLE